jgi:hypothetical protein
MNFQEAQHEFVEFIKSAASKVNAYYWRLSRDAPNSLCKFLGLEEEELKVILRLLRVYNGDNNNFFSKNNFDMLMMMCKPHLDWVPYRLNAKPEHFIKIGHGGEELRPKDFYDSNGHLSLYPVSDQHVPTLRTKSQRSTLMKLLSAGRSAAVKNKETDDIPPNLKTTKHPSPHKTVTPKGLLLGYIQELAIEAGESGNGKLNGRALRTLQRLITSCVDAAAKELLHAVMEKYAIEQDNVAEGKQAVSLSPPDQVLSSECEAVSNGVVVEPVVDFDTPTSFACRLPIDNEDNPVCFF